MLIHRSLLSEARAHNRESNHGHATEQKLFQKIVLLCRLVVLGKRAFDIVNEDDFFSS